MIFPHLLIVCFQIITFFSPKSRFHAIQSGYFSSFYQPHLGSKDIMFEGIEYRVQKCSMK